MTELEVKLVKVDNWGIFFLQRLKHFFNRTDYCDLTLQFQDNAQLKVHRLVLSACTEYFELLERTCEMYEDCLVMPDDLQADVVVPIVNFMYTGQLEFRMDLLERLYQTSQIMNMTILTKLLEAHRSQVITPSMNKSTLNYINVKRSYSKTKSRAPSLPAAVPSSSNQSANKRSHSKAFGNVASVNKEPTKSFLNVIPEKNAENILPPIYGLPNSQPSSSSSRKVILGDPRPTRYELPEELDSENLFSNSFSNISYSSQPLVVHPDSTKKCSNQKKSSLGYHTYLHGGIFDEPSEIGTINIIDRPQVPKKEHIYDENDTIEDMESVFIRDPSPQVSNKLFDNIVEPAGGPKVTIETKDSKQVSNIDHAKIISEVLKKYPHLVKSNKNIKLKILNTPSQTKSRSKKQQISPSYIDEKPLKIKEIADTGGMSTYETDVLDSKEAAQLIALGAENIKGPWICLICGAPGKAIHFPTYYKFRRHLVEVHKEKPIINMCEYCGIKSMKRNNLLHHLLTKHGVQPPPAYHFPKCNSCDYIALTEGLLTKHKMNHGHETGTFKCNVCTAAFKSSKELLAHIQRTGHKYFDKKTNLQCIYCLRVFLRENNLYAHLKTYHKNLAKSDGILEDSDDEKEQIQNSIKFEPQTYDDDSETQYQIRPDGNIELVKAPHSLSATTAPLQKQKILNTGFSAPKEKPIPKAKSPANTIPQIENEDLNEEIVMIGNNEYIMRDNHLIPKKRIQNEFILSDLEQEPEENLTSEYGIQSSVTQNISQEQRMVLKKPPNPNQPIQIVVSSEEEYKALMNSNHSIIFDGGDSNKTLTVLSAPHDSSMTAATLELENNQSNDMMIIQEDYPIGVPQTIPSDNSNIVVVYSQNIDNENKQYQLISSQDIGAQFVPSSAVITQNFGTVTTPNPLITQPGVNRQVHSWINTQNHGNSTQDINEMAVIEQPEITTAQRVEENALNELPEVTLTSVVVTEAENVVTLPQNAVIENHNQKSELVSGNIIPKDSVIPESGPELSNQMDIDIPSDPNNTTAASTAPSTSLHSDSIIIEDVTIGDQTQTEEPIEHDCRGDHIDGRNSEPIEHNEDEQIDNSKKDEMEKPEGGNLEQDQRDPNVLNQIQDTEYENNIVEDQHESVQHESNMVEVPHESNVIEVQQESNVVEVQRESNNVEVQHETISTQVTEINDNSAVRHPAENIQSLTSEWSEDEEDSGAQEQTEKITEVTVLETEESQDMEESIENIQQEMQKQVNDPSQIDTFSPDDVSQIENVQEQPTQELPSNEIITDVPRQQKISSLLNEWDENDSQEGNDSTNGTEEDNVNTVTNDSAVPAQKHVEKATEEKLETNKDSKIQSLVSDWDDEDDEQKE